ncbi:MAG: nuclear transport factor 2 family protein, partial [bacterium]
MKQIASMSALLVAVSLLSLSQLGCQPAPDTNRSASTPASATPEMVDTAGIESELLRIENDWPRVMREKDVIAVKSVEADDGIFIRPDGTVVTKAEDVKDMEGGAVTAESFEMAELKAKVLDKDAAVVSGITIINGGKYKMPDGKTIDISGQYRFIDTFARREGKWQVVAGVSVKAPATSASPAA